MIGKLGFLFCRRENLQGGMREISGCRKESENKQGHTNFQPLIFNHTADKEG